MAQKNRWHPVMLPDDYIRKMKQDLAEAEAMVESKTRCEPDPAAPQQDDDCPPGSRMESYHQDTSARSQVLRTKAK